MSIFLYILAHAFVAYVLFVMIWFIGNGLIWFPALFLGMWILIPFILSRGMIEGR